MHTTFSHHQSPAVEPGQRGDNQHKNQRQTRLHAHAGFEHVGTHVIREYDDISTAAVVRLMRFHGQVRVLVNDLLNGGVWEVVVVHQQQRMLVACQKSAPGLRDVQDQAHCVLDTLH